MIIRFFLKNHPVVNIYRKGKQIGFILKYELLGNSFGMVRLLSLKHDVILQY